MSVNNNSKPDPVGDSQKQFAAQMEMQQKMQAESSRQTHETDMQRMKFAAADKQDQAMSNYITQNIEKQSNLIEKDNQSKSTIIRNMGK